MRRLSWLQLSNLLCFLVQAQRSKGKDFFRRCEVKSWCYLLLRVLGWISWSRACIHDLLDFKQCLPTFCMVFLFYQLQVIYCILNYSWLLVLVILSVDVKLGKKETRSRHKIKGWRLRKIIMASELFISSSSHVYRPCVWSVYLTGTWLVQEPNFYVVTYSGDS